MEASAGPHFCYPLQLLPYSGSPGYRLCCEYRGEGIDRSGPDKITASRFSRSANQYCQNQRSDTANYDILVKKFIRSLNSTDQSFEHKVAISGLTLLLLAILGGIFMFFMRQTIIVMSRHIEFDQKNEIYQHYQQLDTSFL